LNRPVVVSEEALVAPVTVPDDVTSGSAARVAAAGPVYIVLGGISLSHFLNDTMQSLIPSVYPILKESYALDFAQIGLITLAFQFTASLLQPLIGYFTDKKPQPFSLAIGMGSTFFGLLLLSVAQHYVVILIAAALVGLGSAVFHPESARIARLASGGRYGFAQSVFQVGGNLGTSMVRCSRH
jgi:FSR family fosmidomycin resistance protein-like MFS transporter